MRGKRGEDCENGFDGTREHPGKGEQAISECPPESGEAGREEIIILITPNTIYQVGQT